MAMFSIYDGRKSFWQWDSGQRIVVSDDVCCEVHFCNGTSECAMVCEVYTEDGHRLVNVPNILLQASKPIRVFAYAETDGDNRTLHCVTFAVLARTKPADYVYTETEVLSYQALEERVTALEENGGGSPSGTLHLFHKPNEINDYETVIEVSAGKPTDLNEDGRDPKSGVVAFFETHHDGPVILRHLKDGEYDNDAATVGQLKEIDLTIPQKFTKAQKAQARRNIGAVDYYHTDREEIGQAHEDVNAAYIFSLYDALMETYPERVQKVEHTNNDGTFTNYEYVISTGDYPEGTYNIAYGNNPPIKKPKYLVLSGIHGSERKAVFSTYRFVRDILSGRNVPQSFREGVIISVMPVGTPSAFDAFDRYNTNGVNINRNFDWNWKTDGDSTGSSAASENETQAIQNWLSANSDAELFLDFHNNGALNEKVLILSLPDNSISNTARKIALRGVDHIIPYWRDVIGYPDTVEADGLNDAGTGTEVKERDVIYSYSATTDMGGLAFAYAQNVVGIPGIALETASFYGSHTEYAADNTADSPEAVAMGAEALGNILIEFYENEVKNMADIDSKLDTLLQSASFRTESGVYVASETITSNTQIQLPCTNGAKAIEFYADDATLEAIEATTGVKYVGSVVGIVEPSSPNIKTISGMKCCMFYMEDFTSYGYGWKLGANVTSPKNNNGISFNVLAILQGTYHWKAYYWNN